MIPVNALLFFSPFPLHCTTLLWGLTCSLCFIEMASVFLLVFLAPVPLYSQLTKQEQEHPSDLLSQTCQESLRQAEVTALLLQGLQPDINHMTKAIVEVAITLRKGSGSELCRKLHLSSRVSPIVNHSKLQKQERAIVKKKAT